MYNEQLCTQVRQVKKKDIGTQFSEYLETIHPTNLMLQNRKFVEIYNYWKKHIYGK